MKKFIHPFIAITALAALALLLIFYGRFKEIPSRGGKPASGSPAADVTPGTAAPAARVTQPQIPNRTFGLRAEVSPILAASKPMPEVVTGTNIIISTASPPIPVEIGTDSPDELPPINDSPYFTAVTGDMPPEGFISPVVKLAYSDGSEYEIFFDIVIENIQDYSRSGSKYSFRAICLNYDQLNRRQLKRSDGTFSPVINMDRWLLLNDQLFSQISDKGNIYSMPVRGYSTAEEEKVFKLLPGMLLHYRFEVTDGAYTRAYEKTIPVKEPAR